MAVEHLLRPGLTISQLKAQTNLTVATESGKFGRGDETRPLQLKPVPP